MKIVPSSRPSWNLTGLGLDQNKAMTEMLWMEEGVVNRHPCYWTPVPPISQKHEAESSVSGPQAVPKVPGTKSRCQLSCMGTCKLFPALDSQSEVQLDMAMVHQYRLSGDPLRHIPNPTM